MNRETRPGERRVALVPRGVQTLTEAGHTVVVPAGAGAAAGFRDEDYRAAGAEIGDGPASEADLVLAVGPVAAGDVAPTGAVVSFLDPLGDPAGVAGFAAAGTTAFAMELIPRTTLAQSMDALSSQATSAGYEAVLAGASQLPRFLPMMMTAAGTIRPAKVLVLGAGVAGLTAIATARRLGAVVAGYDIRPAAREQVESLGATFVGGPVEESAEAAGGYAGEVSSETRDRQLEALANHVAAADLVITTAQVPGRAAPLLISAAMVEAMAPGSVVVDLATAGGGNCEVSEPGKTIVHSGVTVMGPLDLPSRTAGHASDMYSRNVVSLVTHLTGDDGMLKLDMDDEITATACVAHEGAIVADPVRALLEEGT